MVSLKLSTASVLLATFASAVQGSSLTAPKGQKVLTVGVIGGMMFTAA
jgi:hypothetical protein